MLPPTAPSFENLRYGPCPTPAMVSRDSPPPFWTLSYPFRGVACRLRGITPVESGCKWLTSDADGLRRSSAPSGLPRRSASIPQSWSTASVRRARMAREPDDWARSTRGRRPRSRLSRASQRPGRGVPLDAVWPSRRRRSRHCPARWARAPRRDGGRPGAGRTGRSRRRARPHDPKGREMSTRRSSRRLQRAGRRAHGHTRRHPAELWAACVERSIDVLREKGSPC